MTTTTNTATKTATITGEILKGNYLGAPMRSCEKVDYVTEQRVIVTIDGVDYDRAVYERAIWRNGKPNTVLARFVWVNGKFYVLADEEETVEETTDTRTVYTVTDGFGEYRQYGDDIELRINNAGGEDFEDKEEAIARYIELSGRGAMRAAWSCEFECGGCIRKALAYQVELVAYSEEYDADSGDWNVVESNMIYCEKYDIDDYKADME